MDNRCPQEITRHFKTEFKKITYDRMVQRVEEQRTMHLKRQDVVDVPLGAVLVLLQEPLHHEQNPEKHICTPTKQCISN
jgi:hypothetical protein